MKYLLDTNICVYWLKGNQQVEQKILSVGIQQQLIQQKAKFVVMKTMRITRAFTADRHFEQAGFSMLLK